MQRTSAVGIFIRVRLSQPTFDYRATTLENLSTSTLGQSRRGKQQRALIAKIFV